MAQAVDPDALCLCSQHEPPPDWSGWIGGDNPTRSQTWQSYQDWANVHDKKFNAPVALGQLAPWQHVKGLITDDNAMVLAQRAAITTLRELLLSFRHWRLCDCRMRSHTKKEGYCTHCGMQIGWRKIQLPDDGADTVTVPPAGSDRDTWMQAYT